MLQPAKGLGRAQRSAGQLDSGGLAHIVRVTIGLGLAVSRQVIQQHQGSLDVVSTPGKGSTFTMTLKQWR